jgi:hypothetical protein
MMAEMRKIDHCSANCDEVDVSVGERRMQVWKGGGRLMTWAGRVLV